MMKKAAKINLTVQLLKGKKTVTQLNAIFLRLNSSNLSKHVFIAVSDFGTRKKIQFFPPHPEKGQISNPQEVLTRLIPYLPGTENSQIPRDVEVLIWSAHN